MSFAPFDEHVARLLDASSSESRPWLMELVRRQAARKRPSDVLAQFRRDGFVAPSMLDQRLAHQLDGLALDAASAYEAVLLSPVAPLGCCSAIAPGSQDRIMSTLRGTEVVSDPTNVMALVCAERLRAAAEARGVRLCTVHQTLRAQPLAARAGHSRHFRMFALADAGYGLPDDQFEVDAIAAQLTTFDRLFDAAERTLGVRFGKRAVLLRFHSARRVLIERLAARLANVLPHAPVTRALFESAYYDGVRVSFSAAAANGDIIPIGDIGVFDWMARLNHDKRLRFVAGGFGLQLVPLLFKRS
jgi:hypothetical protein